MATILMYLLIGLTYSTLLFGLSLGLDVLIGTFGTDKSIVTRVYGKSIPEKILKILFVVFIWPISMTMVSMKLITDYLNVKKGP